MIISLMMYYANPCMQCCTISGNLRTAEPFSRKDEQDLISKEWSCSCCSPLLHFDLSDPSLEMFKNKLKSFLDLKNLVHNRNKRPLLVEINVITSFTEEKSLKITIEGAGCKDKLTVYLWSVNLAEQCSFTHDFSKYSFLPLIMYSGPREVYSLTCLWLEREYMCYIHPLNFDPISLSLIAKLCLFKSSRVCFTWKVPEFISGVDKVLFSVTPESLSVFSKALKCDSSKTESSKDVTFLSILNSILSSAVKVSAFQLDKISCRLVDVSSVGNVNFKNAPELSCIISHLCGLAVRKVFIFSFNVEKDENLL